MTNQISTQNLPSIYHNGIPVITTELLAELYTTDVVRIRQNHARNADRFSEGKHFFILKGKELQELKNRVSLSYSVESDIQLVGKRARSLTLWTERGAARHAKMLDTDKAWDVFEALEDCYFSQKDTMATSTKTTTDERTPLRDAVNMLVGKRGLMYPEAYSFIHQRFNVSHIDQLPAEKITEAVEYVHKLALEGEYLGKETSLSLNGIQFPENGKILITIRNSTVDSCEIVRPDSHVLTLNTFMELAQKAGYLIIHRENFLNMENSWKY
ncbi:ORF6N domain-containing protein [Photorhabdus temperata subsp. temperata]